MNRILSLAVASLLAVMAGTMMYEQAVPDAEAAAGALSVQLIADAAAANCLLDDRPISACITDQIVLQEQPELWTVDGDTVRLETTAGCWQATVTPYQSRQRVIDCADGQ